MENTTFSKEQETAIRRIQKLMSLGQSQNQAEAELAMAMAQELLAKYNLAAAMIQDKIVPGGVASAVPEKREQVRIKRSAQYKWQQKLWRAIAEANFCFYSVTEVFEGKRGTSRENTNQSKVPVKRHLVLGRESNVIAVRMMGEYLEDTMERILPYPNHERLSRAANSWKSGCVDSLCTRIMEQAEQRKAASDAARAADGNTTALVLRDVYTAEYAANYNVRYGEGAWEQMQIDDAKWRADQSKREQQAAERREKAEKDWLIFLQNESPADKAKREKKEAKERIKNEKRWERSSRTWENERRREARKIDHNAYYDGRVKGREIGIDSQVGAARGGVKEIV